MIAEANSTGLQGDWQLILFFGLIAAIVTFTAFKRGFFVLPKTEDPPFLRFWHVLIAFSFYLFLLFFLSPLIGESLNGGPVMENEEIVSFISWVNFSVLVLTALFILFFFGCLFRNIFLKILKRSNTPISKDALLAFISWVIAFPMVVMASEILDSFTQKLFKVKEVPEQIAIQYFHMATEYPFYLVIALISIIILAPFVEEFLFRGLLQNWLKSKFGVKKGIFYTAICFSFFHFSPSQGLGNISIVGALFILALFLGFIYERQRSLYASFFLHSLFNSLSIINLLIIKP